MKTFSFCILLLFASYSCQFKQQEPEPEPEKIASDSTYILKKYYEKSGDIKSEISIKNKKKHGPAKEFYPTGELRTLVNYIDNVKSGETFWYYKNGQIYRLTPYLNGKMDGIRKVYYENGKLQAEIPYKKGQLQEGSKEYSKEGIIITTKEKINITTKDLIKYTNKYIIQLSLSQKHKGVVFYQEKTSTEGNKIRVNVLSSNGMGQVEFLLPPGSFEMSVLKFYAEFKSKLGNPIMISTTYNLAIENR